MNEQPTPETDAVEAAWMDVKTDPFGPIKHARNLERKLNEAHRLNTWNEQQVQALHEGLHQAKNMVAAMREAIKGAYKSLSIIANAEGSPDIDVSGDYQFGLHCGVEDRGCVDRYEGSDYGWSQGVERTLEWSANEATSAIAKLSPFITTP